MTKKKKPAKKLPSKPAGAGQKKTPPAKHAKPATLRKDSAAAPGPEAVRRKAAPLAVAETREGAALPAAEKTSETTESAAGKPARSTAKDNQHTADGKTLGAGVISDRVTEAAQPLQTFAVEMQRMAKQSIEQTSEVLERLRDAKSVEEVVSLQTTFMQQSFRRYTEFAGRISALMTASHANLFQQSQAAMRSFRSIASGM